VPPDQGATAAGRHDVLVPFDVGTVGQLDDKSLFGRGDDDRGFIDLSSSPTDVPDDPEVCDSR
jgi:hypothetical protein